MFSAGGRCTCDALSIAKNDKEKGDGLFIDELLPPDSVKIEAAQSEIEIVECDEEIPENINTHEAGPSTSIPAENGSNQINQSATSSRASSYFKQKQRRQRTHYSTQQIQALESIYDQHHYPDGFMREELSLKLGLPETQVKIWFKNRRAKSRKEKNLPV